MNGDRDIIGDALFWFSITCLALAGALLLYAFIYVVAHLIGAS